MGKGIAVLFKKKFGGVDDILSQGNGLCVLQSIPLINPSLTLNRHLIDQVSTNYCLVSVSQDFDHVYNLSCID